MHLWAQIKHILALTGKKHTNFGDKHDNNTHCWKTKFISDKYKNVTLVEKSY